MKYTSLRPKCISFWRYEEKLLPYTQSFLALINQVFFNIQLKRSDLCQTVFVIPLKLFAELVELNIVSRGTDHRSASST